MARSVNEITCTVDEIDFLIMLIGFYCDQQENSFIELSLLIQSTLFPNPNPAGQSLYESYSTTLIAGQSVQTSSISRYSIIKIKVLFDLLIQ